MPQLWKKIDVNVGDGHKIYSIEILYDMERYANQGLAASFGATKGKGRIKCIHCGKVSEYLTYVQ